MSEHRRACLGTEAGDDVDDTLWQSGIEQRLHDVDGRKWSIFGRLDHAGVAADESREELPRWDRHRKVPRSDHAAHAYRLADGHCKLVRKFGRHSLTEEAASFARHVVGGIDCFL